MKRRSFSACAGVLALMSAACQPRSTEFTDQDRATVRAMFDSTVVWIRADNWARWSEQFAEDAVLHAPNAPAVRGRAALLDWGQSFPELETIEFTDVQVQGNGDLAYGSSAYTLKLKDAPEDRGKQLIVARRSPTGWEIIAGSFNSDLPLPGAPPPSTATRD